MNVKSWLEIRIGPTTIAKIGWVWKKEQNGSSGLNPNIGPVDILMEILVSKPGIPTNFYKMMGLSSQSMIDEFFFAEIFPPPSVIECYMNCLYFFLFVLIHKSLSLWCLYFQVFYLNLSQLICSCIIEELNKIEDLTDHNTTTKKNFSFTLSMTILVIQKNS